MDARKLYKGAAGVRKGQAMLAWLGDVGEALTEVGDLGKTLVDLREKVVLARGKHDALVKQIMVLTGKHTGAEAEAHKIRVDAEAAAAAITAKAQAQAVAIVEKATAQAKAQHDDIEMFWETHKNFMAEAGAKEIVLRGKVAKLTEELAAIKARL